MPPAPTLAQNRGSASPRHNKADLAPAPSPSAAVTGSTSRAAPLPRTRSNKGNINSNNAGIHPREAPPAPATPGAYAHASLQSHQHRPKRFRRWVARILLVYLSYTFFFVCPNQPDPKSNKVCDSIVKAQNWLRPYSEPVAEKLDETYRTYAEPYVDQYGRPLYKQGHKYYFDVAHPALMTT
jgi:hypothetical protein